jgi:DNA-binding PadR family transcriptional regulator
MELSERSMHGYELALTLKIPVTGIYQHLKELSEDGLIQSSASGRRKVYSLTERGKKLAEVIKS